MAVEDSSSQSFFTGFKKFWADRLSFVDRYNKFADREKPLPSWSDDDVYDFIASDPVHGPTLKTVREASEYGVAGGVIGAVSTAGIAWKYSKSLHGTGLSFLAGGVFGFTFGSEVANHAFQLYRLDTVTAQTRFLEWWANKCERRF